jgi:6,7-dimethyl-8-ribityllumazine synthase
MSNSSRFEAPPAAGDGRGLHIALVVARYNPEITEAQQQEARRSLLAQHVAPEDIEIWYAPGAFELPLIARTLSERGGCDAIICLGCIMQGETRHAVLVGDATAQALQRVALDGGLPVIFGVICAADRQQAEARIARAAECALTAIAMVHTLRRIRSGERQ